MNNMRTERDSMGAMQVPDEALYGASTQRAVENFPIAHRPIAVPLIHAFGHLKAASAQANIDLGKLDARLGKAIIDASDEVAQGHHDAGGHFPVDIYQTGSGTSSNMNVNEVIARRANQILELDAGKRENLATVHPNDHVNMGQSSNDTFPTAMHIAAAEAAANRLLPMLDGLQESLAAKAAAWDDIVKIGRTHLMDATPIRVGQVFSGYAAQAEYSVRRAMSVVEACRNNLPIGGTAVGTGINTHPDFARRVCAVLSQRLGLKFVEATNHPEAQAAKDSFVEAHGHLRTIAVSLSKIANDIRHLGSGPRCGIFELLLPEIQPGSSIMPGKVNPVICESVMQVACRVIGNDATITTAALGGIGSLFELNVAMPVMAEAILESIQLLTNVSDVLRRKLIDGLEVNRQRCEALVEQSLMMVTALAPVLGYDKAATIAKRAFKEGTTIRELVTAEKLMDPAKLDELLDPRRQTQPHE